MVRGALVLLAAASAATTVNGLFSVNDDILAFPQYEIQFPQEPIPASEASALLAQAPTSSASPDSTTTPNDAATSSESYEALWLNNRQYLCSVPVVQAPPALNATEKELSRAAEEKELARATTRGWELLSGLEGECLYFVSGWWSYSYCHNREVRQFHQKAPTAGNNAQWPPAEDPMTPSYVLGMVTPEQREREKGKGAGTELQATGELRFLVQKLGGGTTCDLTRKERKIEIQFHCSTKGTHDRIGWIKEISICCYLMVVYTPRLCDDVAFLPPREDRANAVQCREIMDPETLAEYYEQKAEIERTEALELLQAALGLTAGEAEEGQSKVEKKKGKKKKSAVAGEGKKKKKATEEEEEEEEEEKVVLGKGGEGAEEHWHDEL
ncbi:hypothetical protein P167DRAFT_515009 [Morchella conica CCBAS932]|uniref:Endoplasmic reticulum lectin n=1 Tax=Morchella conica CCBAS932 TaxID=1392247 RepID=A0A3N4L478_9PEZI|nr:hypothetical protein P167DRAFT_515009 [Morchella conica CCBAS932]